MKKFILAVLFIISILFCTLGTNAYSINSNKDLEFKVNRVESNINSMRFSINIINNTDNNYTYGWVNTSDLIVETDEGVYKTVISSISTNIKPGNNYRSITVLGAKGNTIKSITITDVRVLENNLPVHGSQMTLSADVSTISISRYLTFQNIIFLVILLISGFIFYKECIKGYSHKLAGIFILTSVIGVSIIILSLYYFLFKPFLGFEDSDNVTKLGWISFLIGMVVIAASVFLFQAVDNGLGVLFDNFKKEDSYSSRGYSGNNQFEENNRQFQQQINREQNRLFQEQMFRNQQQQVDDLNYQMEDHNRAMQEHDMMAREADDSARQSFDSFNQQNDINSFNDFNNYNDFNNNNFF